MEDSWFSLNMGFGAMKSTTPQEPGLYYANHAWHCNLSKLFSSYHLASIISSFKRKKFDTPSFLDSSSETLLLLILSKLELLNELTNKEEYDIKSKEETSVLRKKFLSVPQRNRNITPLAKSPPTSSSLFSEPGRSILFVHIFFKNAFKLERWTFFLNFTHSVSKDPELEFDGRCLPTLSSKLWTINS